VAARPRDELDNPVTRLQALHGVVMPVEDDSGAVTKRIPKRRYVGLVAISATAVARTVPEGQPARTGALDLLLKPAKLW
jgi:hypothetical protein